MTEIASNKPRYNINGEYQVTKEDALKNLLKIATKINEFNKLPIRYENIEKISEILNMVKEQMLDLIMYDNDAIYYGLMVNVVSVLNYYKENKSVYNNKPTDIVSKFESILNTTTEMTMLYLKSHFEREENEIQMEEKFEEIFEIQIN